MVNNNNNADEGKYEDKERLVYIDIEEEKKDRFERQKRIEWWDQKLLKDSNILVVGAGTLGNEVCKNLALLGIGNVTIIDMDEIEEVNLSRSVLFRTEDNGRMKADVAAKRMKELYSEMNVTPINCNVVYDYGNVNYKDFKIVLMTVDNIEARRSINKYCYMWGTPLINGGLDGLRCSVQVIIPHKTACYECTLTEEHYSILKNRKSCYGMLRDAPEGKIPMVITSAAIAGGLMVQEALRILHNKEPNLAGKIAKIDGDNEQFYVLNIPERKDCLGHWFIDQDHAIYIDFSNKITLKEFKEKIREELKNKKGKNYDGNILIRHDNDIIYECICPSCNTRKEFLCLTGKAKHRDLICDKCGELSKPDISNELKLDDKTLEEHGVPDNHTLTAYLSNGEIYDIIPKKRFC